MSIQMSYKYVNDQNKENILLHVSMNKQRPSRGRESNQMTPPKDLHVWGIERGRSPKSDWNVQSS